MSETRIRQLPSGLIDELFVEQCGLDLRRAGDARYSISLFVTDQEGIEMELWTSRKGRIEARIENNKKWINTTYGPHGQVQSLEAKTCTFHLENLDRGHHRIGLTSANDQRASVSFLTTGYLKVRLISKNK